MNLSRKTHLLQDSFSLLSSDKKGSNLTITKVKYEDAGHYVCQLGTNANCQLISCPIVYFDVKVDEASKIERSPKDKLQTATKGENITFSCDPRGDMELKVTWTRLDKTLPDGNNETENTQLMFVSLYQPVTKCQL